MHCLFNIMSWLPVSGPFCPANASSVKDVAQEKQDSNAWHRLELARINNIIQRKLGQGEAVGRAEVEKNKTEQQQQQQNEGKWQGKNRRYGSNPTRLWLWLGRNTGMWAVSIELSREDTRVKGRIQGVIRHRRGRHYQGSGAGAVAWYRPMPRAPGPPGGPKAPNIPRAACLASSEEN